MEQEILFPNQDSNRSTLFWLFSNEIDDNVVILTLILPMISFFLVFSYPMRIFYPIEASDYAVPDYWLSSTITRSDQWMANFTIWYFVVIFLLYGLILIQSIYTTIITQIILYLSTLIIQLNYLGYRREIDKIGWTATTDYTIHFWLMIGCILIQVIVLSMVMIRSYSLNGMISTSFTISSGLFILYMHFIQPNNELGYTSDVFNGIILSLALVYIVMRRQYNISQSDNLDHINQFSLFNLSLFIFIFYLYYQAF